MTGEAVPGGHAQSGILAAPVLGLVDGEVQAGAAGAGVIRAPTLTEIGARLGPAQPQHLHYHLAELERKGSIVRDPLRTRSIHLR